MKEKHLQSRILYPEGLSFRFDGEIKSRHNFILKKKRLCDGKIAPSPPPPNASLWPWSIFWIFLEAPSPSSLPNVCFLCLAPHCPPACSVSSGAGALPCFVLAGRVDLKKYVVRNNSSAPESRRAPGTQQVPERPLLNARGVCGFTRVVAFNPTR